MHPNTCLLTEADAARFLAVSRSYLRCARSTGDPTAPPFVRIGRRGVRYRVDDLLQWVESRRRDPAQTGGGQ